MNAMGDGAMRGKLLWLLENGIELMKKMVQGWVCMESGGGVEDEW